MTKTTDEVGGELHTLLLSLIETIERASGKTPFNQELLLALIKGLDEKIGLLIAAQKEGVKTAMDAAEKAVTKAEVASDKRFEGLNELRGMAADWRNEFARQDSVNLQIEGLSEKIEAVKDTLSATNSDMSAIKARGLGRGDVWAWLFAGMVAGGALATLVVELRLLH